MSDYNVNIIACSSYRQDDKNVSLISAVKPYLNDPKTIKLMSVQDQLSVICASQAVNQAGLSELELGKETGIYMAVGYISFDDLQIAALSKYSEENSKFSMKRFSKEAIFQLNPLLTFKCLPNMALYHVSNELRIHGRYFISYPGPGQWFQCLERAVNDLQAGRVSYALVGAATYQNNKLVKHQIGRMDIGPAKEMVDIAAFWVLTKGDNARTLAMLRILDIHYHPFDPLSFTATDHTENKLFNQNFAVVEPQAYLTSLIKSGKKDINFCYKSHDGIQASIGMEVA